MNIIVVGCGRVGADLAYRLYKRKHRVIVIDQVASAFDNLPPDFHGHTVEGEVLYQDVLSRAGIEHADGLAAVTNSDSLNAVVAHIARTVYHIPNVVVRNYDPHWRIWHEAFGLQVVSSASWGAQRMEEILSDAEIHSIFSAGNGEVAIYELVVPDTWQGRKLEELNTQDECLVVALSRSGRAMLPAPEMLLEACDIVHLSATPQGIAALQARLKEG